MKIWITKYALTGGIAIRDTISDSGSYVYVKESIGQSQYRLGVDCFPNPISANAHADKMRVKKIESLRKQIQKLENMKFD